MGNVFKAGDRFISRAVNFDGQRGTVTSIYPGGDVARVRMDGIFCGITDHVIWAMEPEPPAGAVAVTQAIDATLPPVAERCRSCGGWGRIGDDIPCTACDTTGRRFASVETEYATTFVSEFEHIAVPVAQINPEHVAAILGGDFRRDSAAARSTTIGAFLIYLDGCGIHLAEYSGGGTEPRVSSELHESALHELIAGFVSRR